MFKSLKGGILPQRKTKYSAGFDVCANEDVIIGAGETKVIGLGIALDDIDVFVYNCNYHGKLSEQNSFYDDLSSIEKLEFFKETHYFMLCLRSSLGSEGLILPNGHGVIDIDYVPHCKIQKSLNNGECIHFKQKQKE